MLIKLYRNLSEKRARNKTLEEVDSLEGKMLDGGSVVDPSFKIEYATKPNCNYAEIPELGRKYFINDIINIREGLWRLEMHSDVLCSAENLDNVEAVIERQEFVYNWYLKDSNIQTESDFFVTTHTLTNEEGLNPDFNVEQYYLISQGGYEISEQGGE